MKFLDGWDLAWVSWRPKGHISGATRCRPVANKENIPLRESWIVKQYESYSKAFSIVSTRVFGNIWCGCLWFLILAFHFESDDES